MYGDRAASGEWQAMTLLLQAGAVRAWFTSHNLTHIWPKKIKRWFITPRAARVLARSDPVGETWWDVSLEQIWALLSGVQQKRLTEMWGCRELWESVCTRGEDREQERASSELAFAFRLRMRREKIHKEIFWESGKAMIPGEAFPELSARWWP